jgi:hypoxanthine phosphoribosyltransferase
MKRASKRESKLDGPPQPGKGAVTNLAQAIGEADQNCPCPVPARWKNELDRVLIPEVCLQRRIGELSREITADFAGRDCVVVALLNGTILFIADLIRQLSFPLRLDFMGVSSYGSGTTSRELIFTKDLRLDVRGRHVLLVDDILDTGKTLTSVLERLHKLRPKAIKTCVLLDKAARRIEPIEADYVGFKIEDLFVVGYGLDFAERYRNLPFVAVLKPHLYQAPPTEVPV